jgi:hypothetical protein
MAFGSTVAAASNRANEGSRNSYWWLPVPSDTFADVLCHPLTPNHQPGWCGLGCLVPKTLKGRSRFSTLRKYRSYLMVEYHSLNLMRIHPAVFLVPWSRYVTRPSLEWSLKVEPISKNVTVIKAKFQKESNVRWMIGKWPKPNINLKPLQEPK